MRGTNLQEKRKYETRTKDYQQIFKQKFYKWVLTNLALYSAKVSKLKSKPRVKGVQRDNDHSCFTPKT